MTAATWPTGGSPASTTWKYQGRLDLSPTTTSLYDFAARDYAPGLGAFTSLDSVLGSAQNPLQLNRFLYAAANPATLVDPDGHAFIDQEGTGAAIVNTIVRHTSTVGRGTNRSALLRADAAAEYRATHQRIGSTNSSTAGRRTGPTYTAYVDPQDLATDPGWQRTLKLAEDQAFSPVNAWLNPNQRRANLDSYNALVSAAEANAAGFCGATGSLCQDRQTAQGLGLLSAVDAGLTIASIADAFPGDEVAMSGVDAATAARMVQAEQDLSNDVQRLEGRVMALQDVLDARAQRMRTAAAVGTDEGIDVLGGGGRDLTPEQIRRIAKPGDVTGILPNAHAEPTVIYGAWENNLTIRSLVASRQFCPACQAVIVDAGGTIVAPDKAIWLGP